MTDLGQMRDHTLDFKVLLGVGCMENRELESLTSAVRSQRSTN